MIMTEYISGIKVPAQIKEETVIQFVGTKNTGKLRLGLNVSASVGEEAKRLTEGRVLLVVDPQIVRLKLDQAVRISLEKAGLDYDVFDKVEPEPHIETIEVVRQQVHCRRYGLVIGLGGGSSMDTAKLAAVTACNDFEIRNFFTDTSLLRDVLPTILMPTTAGTGSEMSPYIVISDRDRKVFAGSPLMYATVALVDPLLTKTMPPKVTAYTGLDALTHGVEGAIGKNNPYTLAMAGKCAELVFRYLPRAVADGNDIEARYYMSFASVLGMLAYTQGGGLFAHSISYILTIACGLPHGAGCGLALPYTLRFNEEYIQDILGALETSIGHKDFILQVTELVKKIGAPYTLKQVGITEDMLEPMANILIDKYNRQRNPRKMDFNQALSLMRQMYQG